MHAFTQNILQHCVNQFLLSKTRNKLVLDLNVTGATTYIYYWVSEVKLKSGVLTVKSLSSLDNLKFFKMPELHRPVNLNELIIGVISNVIMSWTNSSMSDDEQEN